MLRVVGLGCLTSVASDQDRFRDLAKGLYNIGLTRYSRGVTTKDAAGVPVTGWTREAARVGAFASNLAISATDYPTGRA